MICIVLQKIQLVLSLLRQVRINSEQAVAEGSAKVKDQKYIPLVLSAAEADVISVLLAHFVSFFPPKCGIVTFISPTGSVQLKCQNWIFGTQFTSLLKYL
jgi:hypothetical protein